MKEKLNNHIERSGNAEALIDYASNNEIRSEKIESKLHNIEEHDHSIDKIQESIHREAVSAKKTKAEQDNGESSRVKTPIGLQREIKTDAYKKTLSKVQGKLSVTDRAFSKFIHNKNIEAVSEASSKTIARPSALLGAGLLALTGSTIILYLSKHYGFQYNLSIFFILFGAGFLLGISIEVVTLLFRKRS